MDCCRKLIRIIIGVTTGIAVLTGCRDHPSLLPRSGGEPYEVLLMTDNTEARALADSVLTEEVEGLPQSESLCRVSHATQTALNQSTRYARCIVTVRIGKTYPRTAIRYEKNVYAEPQLIVTLNTPSTERMKADMGQVAPLLTQLIDRFELNAEADNLKRHSFRQGEEAVAKITGWRIRIPADMTAIKRGRDFIWLSNNTPTGMRNLCVYTYPGTSLDARHYLDMRDSIMRENIPGERPGMYMATERRVPPLQRNTREHGRTRLVTRGLWMMEGDAMGGPFVSHAIIDTARKKVIVAEGFVYAPESKKRNKIKQLEAALYTLAPAKNQP